MLKVCEYCEKSYDAEMNTDCPYCNRQVRTHTYCPTCRKTLEGPEDIKERYVHERERNNPLICPNCKKRVHRYITPIILLLLLLPQLCFAQKKPTIMILPSDNWCEQRYFMTVYNNQGVKEHIPNYQQAFLEDIELGPVVSMIGEIMTRNGYSVKDAEQEVRNIATRTAEDNVTFSKSSGASISESPLDILKKRAKADIIVQVNWNINRTQSGKSVTFTIEAFDAYSNKRIATSSGTGKSTSLEVPIIIQKAVKKNMKTFDKQLTSYFKVINSKGREIVLTIKTWDNWEHDLETEYEGEELLSIIENWLSRNTIKKSFNLSDASEDMAQFEQVMIPLFDKEGKELDARGFAKGLQKHLAEKPYGISSKLMMRGLGEAILILGEK